MDNLKKMNAGFGGIIVGINTDEDYAESMGKMCDITLDDFIGHMMFTPKEFRSIPIGRFMEVLSGEIELDEVLEEMGINDMTEEQQRAFMDAMEMAFSC